jgi:predicted RNase H-like nuclease
VRVAGVDGCREGWVAVVLQDGRFSGALSSATFRELLKSLSTAEVIAIDIPIGCQQQAAPEQPTKQPKTSSAVAATLFLTSPTVREASSYDEAKHLASGRKPSTQSFALEDYVNDCLALDQRVREVHPEVSFTEMNRRSPLLPKKSWNGFWERRSLLARQGIEIPEHLPLRAGAAQPDDILDAGAAAWTALRIGRGEAGSLPSPPEDPDRRQVAIWY